MNNTIEELEAEMVQTTKAHLVEVGPWFFKVIILWHQEGHLPSIIYDGNWEPSYEVAINKAIMLVREHKMKSGLYKAFDD